MKSPNPVICCIHESDLENGPFPCKKRKEAQVGRTACNRCNTTLASFDLDKGPVMWLSRGHCLALAQPMGNVCHSSVLLPRCESCQRHWADLDVMTDMR